MKVSNKLFDTILENLNQTKFTVYDNDNFEIVLEAKIKCFTIEIFSNQDVDFEVEKCQVTLNTKERIFDLTKPQLITLKVKLTNEIDLAFEKYDRLEKEREKEEDEHINDIDYLGYIN